MNFLPIGRKHSSALADVWLAIQKLALSSMGWGDHLYNPHFCDKIDTVAQRPF